MQLGNDSKGKPTRLDLNLIELLDSVWRTRNLTATGLALNLSQPAVSRGLARLRLTYGDPLFVRQQRGVTPTPLAEQLASSFASVLELVRATASSSTFAPTTDARQFQIAFSDIGERYFLPRLCAWLNQHAPNMTLNTVSPSQPELVEGLASSDIDLGVGFFPGLGKQVKEQRLIKGRYVYVARSGHPTIKGSLTTAQLRALPHVVGAPLGTQHATAVEKVLTSHGVRAAIALRVRSFLSIGPIVAGSDMVAVLPSSLAKLLQEHLNLQIIAPPVRFPAYDVNMVWHRRLHRDPANAWLRTAFVDLFGES
jgi:DNA-binding transcriptional LysR family regulator